MRSRIVPLAAFIIGIVFAGGAARSAGGPPAADMLPLSAIKSSGAVWAEGTNYEVLTSAPPAAPAAGKVEILEFFQYGCPHCYTVEPHMVLWKRMFGNLATVTRVPVTFRPPLRSLARLYYTLESLGRVDAPGRLDLHHEVFDRLLRDGTRLMSDNEEEDFKVQLQFAVAEGVGAAEFTKAYRSEAVQQKVQRAEELGTTYRIASTPMFVIARKYKTDIRGAGDEYRLMHLLTDLSLKALPH
jgi:thiol:disulfide interchange protein DsbA